MRLRLIDMFCGAGGMTLGFTSPHFGGYFDCVLALDSDWAATKTHELNFRGRTVTADIESWLSQDPEVPQADVVIGGPPCQGFSLLNKKRATDDRRGLWEPFLQVVAQSEAPMFIMENVAELSSSQELIELRRRATSMGFQTHDAILNASDYGTPQHRKRAIVVGWNALRTGCPNFPPLPTHFDPQRACAPRWKTVRDAIHDLPPPQGTEVRTEAPPLNLHFARSPTHQSQLRYRAVPPGGNRHDLQKNAPEITPQCWIRKTSGGTDLFGRLWWDRPSVTIRTEFFKPEKGRYLHPDQHRPITHREAARLMGFPDDFVFVGSKIEIAKQMGNAVPPPLAAALAEMAHRAITLNSSAQEPLPAYELSP